MFYGWRKVEMTDHEFAAYLRKLKAVDKYLSRGNIVEWSTPGGVCVAVAVFDNANCERDIYLPPEPKVKEQTK